MSIVCAGCFVSEPIYVPRKNAAEDADEDDGCSFHPTSPSSLTVPYTLAALGFRSHLYPPCVGLM